MLRNRQVFIGSSLDEETSDAVTGMNFPESSSELVPESVVELVPESVDVVISDSSGQIGTPRKRR